MNPLPPELSAQLAALSPVQLAWLSGWCWAKADGNHAATAADLVSTPAPAAAKITILSASQTGNARHTAEKLHARLQAQGTAAVLVSAADYKPKNLADEDIVLLITSTQGEGEPPEEAVSLYKFLHGKKAPKLDGLRFAVLGLGDSSYARFCGAAVDFDAKLAELGGTRLLERRDCDLDFQAAADAWTDEISTLLQQVSAAASSAPAVSVSGSPAVSAYSKNQPFPATLLTRQKITGRGSDKDVRHIELDLDGSGLHYQAGDALGVWFDNDPALADAVLDALALDGSQSVNVNGQSKTLRDALIHDYELTQNTPQFVKGYAAFADNSELNATLADATAFAQSHPIISVIRRYPATLTAADLTALLRPLTPRLYSISSSPEEVGSEVHLTVSVVRYEHDGSQHQGGASSYLAERAEEDGSVRVFIEPNPHFRLPENPDTPVIMIASGTGIAPFRAFVQQRAATAASGRNWLIFGNPHFSEDFLYQTEWQRFAKDGYLHRYSFAWSRDQAEKVYVQDKIRAEAAELWQWLQNGAHIYVCGDAGKMAKDVENALLDVIATQGGLDADGADEYLDGLRQDKRYQRDVY